MILLYVCVCACVCVCVFMCLYVLWCGIWPSLWNEYSSLIKYWCKNICELFVRLWVNFVVNCWDLFDASSCIIICCVEMDSKSWRRLKMQIGRVGSWRSSLINCAIVRGIFTHFYLYLFIHVANWSINFNTNIRLLYSIYLDVFVMFWVSLLSISLCFT